ncbi:MAG: hypothetical protein HYZ51_00370 [Candidatus Doudnabacteria bacterium]|nr:hypothetical protein [Candidatus Doudnabacteria bacterium]
MNNDNNDKTFLKVGLLAGFIAALCCIGPLILIALGLGTASSVLSIGYRKPYFIAGALIFFVVAVVFYIRKRNKAVCDCVDGSVKTNTKSLVIQILIAFIVMALLYLFLTFVLVPYLAPLVYKYLY